MNKLFIALLSLCAATSLFAAAAKQEDQSHLAKLRAEINAKEEQVDRLHQEIARDREALARAESAECVRKSEAVQKSFGAAE
jgi:cell division protein FtsB